MVVTKRKIFEVSVSRLLENSFLALFLTPEEPQLAHCLSATAAIFLEI